MKNFTKRIQIEQGFNPEFAFHRIFSVEGIVYFITVKDKNLISHLFRMEQTKGKWKLMFDPKIPTWVLPIEDELDKAILENTWLR